ncbi:MAG: N-acyl-D-glucosamine 2-epimerase, partial [Bacteroidia bacterium]
MIRTPEQILSDLAADTREELTKNILPFWISMMPDNLNGGFYGRIDGENNIIADAPKGAILNARILWTFSAAYEALKEPTYLNTANRAGNYILSNFFDEENGGTYWSLESDG